MDLSTSAQRTKGPASFDRVNRWRRHAAAIVRVQRDLIGAAHTFDVLGERSLAARSRRLGSQAGAVLEQLAAEADREVARRDAGDEGYPAARRVMP